LSKVGEAQIADDSKKANYFRAGRRMLRGSAFLLFALAVLLLLLAGVDRGDAFTRLPDDPEEGTRNTYLTKLNQLDELRRKKAEAAQFAAEMEGRWKDAYVTYVANDGYVIGARVLGASLRATGLYFILTPQT
jgi:hypothetical protein